MITTLQQPPSILQLNAKKEGNPLTQSKSKVWNLHDEGDPKKLRQKQTTKLEKVKVEALQASTKSDSIRVASTNGGFRSQLEGNCLWKARLAMISTTELASRKVQLKSIEVKSKKMILISFHICSNSFLLIIPSHARIRVSQSDSTMASLKWIEAAKVMPSLTAMASVWRAENA